MLELCSSELYKLLDEKDEEIHVVTRLNEQLKGKFDSWNWWKVNFSPTSRFGVASFYNAWRRRQGKLDLSKRKYKLFSNRASSKHFQASYKSQKKKSRS